MKKLYYHQGKAGGGGRVHPAPAGSAVALPAAVLALASALTAEEQEVLAYLLMSCGRRRRRGPHPPEMGCACFGCYKSFWARWDASPNRHLIHRIIDAVEEGAAPGRTARRRRRGGRRDADEPDGGGAHRLHHRHDAVDDGGRDGEEYEGDGEEGVDGNDDESVGSGDNSDCEEKSAVGRLVRFIGEKVWAAWN